MNLLQQKLVKLQSLSAEKKALFYHYESNECEDLPKVIFHVIIAWRVTTDFII